MKGGILIIGSLIWDNNQGGKKDFRKKWRAKRLNVSEKIHLKVPIRYGRKSGDKNPTYTMVFSSGIDMANDFGTAYFVPFKNQPIRSFRGILNQARFLSEAEGSNDKKLCKGNNNKWCTIGIMFNPKFDLAKKEQILSKWELNLKNDEGLIDYDEYRIAQENSILSNRGEILMDWLNPVDKNRKELFDEFDFVIATCTKPNLEVYPSSQELKLNISQDERRYFFSNIENGITTFQDRELI